MLMLTVLLPKTLKAEKEIEANEEKQITGLNIVDNSTERSIDTNTREIAGVSDTDPIYWMGQRTGGDTNRAMVWFGNYWQDSSGTEKTPVLWRTLRSDGVGNYGNVVTLLSEYALNSMWFDPTRTNGVESSFNQHWYNTDSNIRSSDLRVWMNGLETGAMNPDVTSRGTGRAYNKSGGGTGELKGSLYANAFNGKEKEFIVLTSLLGEKGYSTTGGDTKDKVFTLNKADVENTDYFSGYPDSVSYVTPFTTVGSNTISGSVIYQNDNRVCNWMLRSPYVNDYMGICASGHLNLMTWAPAYYGNFGVRCAVNLSPEQVIFTPASSTGTAPISTNILNTCDGHPTTYTDTYEGSFRIFKRVLHPNSGYSVKLSGAVNDSSVQITYNNAVSGDYVTALLVNMEDGKKWSGRIGQVAAGGNGSVKFKLPDSLIPGISNYRIFAWTENESTQTAYSKIAYANLETLVSPTISKQPVVISGKTGTDAIMTAAASGSGALSYEWYITSNTTASGGTKVGTTSTGSCTYKLTSADNGKNYYCVVKNADGDTATSGIAAITVYYPPTIKTSPANISVKQGVKALFSVESQGGNPSSYTYQWQYRTSSSGSWANVTTAQGTGGNTETFQTVTSTAAMNGWQFRCYIGNDQYAAAEGTGVLSNTAALTVYYPPTVNTHPANQSQTVGNNAVFTAAGQNGNPAGLTYLWQYRTSSSGSWVNVSATIGSGETTAALTVPVTAAKNGYQFRCYIGNSQYSGTAGTVTNAATLTAQYQVTYNQNYSGAPANTSVKVNVGGALTLPPYTRSGYELQGWATTNNATSPNVGKGGASYTPANNVTLYAVWKQYTKPVLDTALPKDSKVSQGKNVTFTTGITTAGYPAAYTYQWYYKDGTNTEKTISGATGSSYSLTIPASSNGYKYYCKITHAATGTTQTTREAVLTVYNTPPTPGIQYIGGTPPFPWSSSAEGQAFLPTKGAEAVGGTTLQYQVSGETWKTFSGSKVVTIGTGGSVTETDPASGESARIVVKQEGQNTVKVRAVNTADNSLVSSEVTITTKLDYTAPKAKLNDGKGTVWDQLQNLITFGKYYKENVVFTVSDRKDDPASGVTTASGVKKTSYYINEAKTTAEETELKSITADNIAQKSASWAWQDYTSGSFTVSPDKKFVVYVKVEDNAGNLHFIGSDGLVADATVPTAEVTQNPAGWTNKEVTLTTTASDALSQLADTPYSYDGGSTYVSGNTNTYNSNGEKTIKVKDKAGNILSKTYTISSIDKQKPEISETPDIQVSPEWVTGNGSSAKAVISLSASAVADKEVSGDTTANKGKSGIAGVYLIKAANKSDTTPNAEAIVGKLTGSGEGDQKVYRLEITAPSETTSYYIRTKDNAGNWSSASEAHKATVQVDAQKPAVGKAAANPKEWTNGTITVTASEITAGPSGLDSVYLFKTSSETNQSAGYKMTKSADGSSYTYSLPSVELAKAEIEGERTWQIRAYNKAGVVSNAAAVTTKYDKTQSELSGVQEPDKAEDGSLIYAREKKVKITAKDTLSGLEKITIYKKNTAGGTQPKETILWPKGRSDASGETSDTAGTTGEVTTAIEGIQENGTYVVKAYDMAGNETEKEVEVIGIDRTAPDITGFKKHTEKTESGKKMLVTFKVKDSEAGISKVVYGTSNNLNMSAANEATAGDIDGNKDAGEGYSWYHFETSLTEAETNHYVRASDKVGNQSETVMVYEAEELIDVNMPAKMMFAVIPELGGEKDSRLLSPDYRIKNNNDKTQLEVGMSGFTQAQGGSILLTEGEADKGEEINLKAGKGSEAFSGLLAEGKSLYGLLQGTAGEMSFGTLMPAGNEGSKGNFSYTGSVFDYQRNGSVRLEAILRSRYTAEFHFNICLPKN